ncbi:conserved hypothetical protein (DUF3108) [Formosa agariphila KMM 3901]|uniref:ATP-dependent exoDNAse (Exonuclease V) alpha subunit-helicase superfamily I member n=1 Tax=Formosa agariphila (strain DSM 15362 / KCTC 12365 / LMG 23005 / KMM 3901 / M-2Alg 35-1) TaxID=1347342 RepID=T2KQK5_FORAG|nr:DUF3108 domain-containing protein [Formosa agariphila]CDF81015.1 conserved hypothetical protein (DUF3108) [Formosa agariphila KMM 3901]
MRNLLVFILFSVCMFYKGSAQNQSAFQNGEWFKFDMSYSGFLKAGEATLEVKDNEFKGKPVYHIVGKGWTTGAIKWFFKVEDLYESYIDKSTYVPYKFIRKIDEGGHTKDIEIEFNQSANKALVNNKKRATSKEFDIPKNVQDMVSTFYFLRNELEIEKLKAGDEILVDMFFDEENYAFKLRYLGTETIETEFGKIASLKFRPYVMAGRVFKEEESLTLWVSNDRNKIPLRIKADLAVGSLRADLSAFKGLKHPFKLIAD